MSDMIDKNGERHSRRKPIWPWLLLLVLTLLAIYAWDRANDLFDEFSRNMPAAVIELFEDLFNQYPRDSHSGHAVEVEVMPVEISR
ncbi:hypothetical protein RHIZ_06380 [Rhizobium skierniewicense]|uniref:hypothetical protein n=1 Tax=Rhizobium TaxID=379 RepID=UPI001784B673|nr:MULTISPECIES: hypothetical protein [Rhizobium]MBD8689334.1 hypothetical protein [Rhizobium sp. CFBP 13644]MBD8693120.1 hypothetical protein [Rhizobium sp. CFBP 13717]MCI9865567.1 hypothetical protein [Rhizobium skierniewicense]